VEQVRTGEIALNAAEAHHLRDVLRLPVGTVVEVFDDSGHVAGAAISHSDERHVRVVVQALHEAAVTPALTVAAAVPKGERADWMVEKLSELGVDRFIPLVTARSVVLPAGKNKTSRWTRIAVES